MTPHFFLIFLCLSSVTLCQAEENNCVRITQRIVCGTKVCNTTSHTCTLCQSDADCGPNILECDRSTGRCEIRSLASSFNAKTVGVALTAFFVCALAVVAGIGGGGILVPLFIGALGMPPRLAVGLSQATILGQSFLNTIIVVQRQHPLHPGPLVNYDALLILLPMTLAGTTVGDIVGAVIPDWLRIVFLILLLGYIFKRALAKARASKVSITSVKDAKEDVNMIQISPASSPAVRQSMPLVSPSQVSQVSVDDNEPPQAPLQLYPKKQILIALVLWLFLGIMAYLKGHSSNIVSCGSVGYWLVVSTIVGFNILCASLISRALRRKQSAYNPIEMTDEGAFLSPGEVHWTTRNAIYYPVMAIFAGIGASMLGIGGGMVLGIILLEMKLHNEALSATSGVATFFTASGSAGQFLLAGQIRGDYGALFCGVGVLSTILGQYGINAYIKKHNMSYMIIYSLAAITFGSIVAVFVLGGHDLVETIRSDGYLGFGTLCRD